MQAAARFDPNLGADGYRRTFDASIATRETLVIEPTLPFPGSQQIEFQVPATNQPGCFYDVGSAYLDFRFNLSTPAGPNGYCIITPFQSSLLIFRDWRLMLSGRDVSEESDGLDAYASFHKSAVLFPHNRCAISVNAGAGTYHEGYHLDESHINGHVTWPAIEFQGAGVKTLASDSFRIPMWEALENADYQGVWRIWIPHGLFNQRQYLPANISMILRATLIDSTYKYLMALQAGETALTLTPVSCQLVLPKLVATPNGLQLYERLLVENHMALRYNLLRTETSRFVIPAGQQNANFQVLCRARPMAVCIHCVPLASVDPSTKSDLLHPFEFDGSAVPPFAPTKIYLVLNGEQYPRRTGNAVVRTSSTNNPSHRGTLLQDIDQYRSLCLQTLHSEHKTQPLLNLWSMWENSRAQIVYINTTPSGEQLQGHDYPVSLIGPMDLYIEQFNSIPAASTAIIVTRFYQSTLEISPKTGHVQTDF